jgi:hypothetical protein
MKISQLVDGFNRRPHSTIDGLSPEEQSQLPAPLRGK